VQERVRKETRKLSGHKEPDENARVKAERIVTGIATAVPNMINGGGKMADKCIYCGMDIG